MTLIDVERAQASLAESIDVVRAEQGEADFWLSEAKMKAAPADAQESFQGAMMMVNPYVAANRFKPYAGDTQLVPGIRAVVTRGHTPGHAMYVIESKGEKLVLWGDLMHQAAVQFLDPSVKSNAKLRTEGHRMGHPGSI